MYGTNTGAMPYLAYTGAAGLAYGLLGGVVLIFAGIALVTIAAALKARSRRNPKGGYPARKVAHFTRHGYDDVACPVCK